MGSKGSQTSSGMNFNFGTSTSTPSAPAMQQYQSIIDRANQVSQTPFQAYGGELVAPFNPTQNAAVNTIGGAQGMAMPWVNAATGLAGASATPISPMQYTPQAISGFMSPYLSAVAGSTMANINETNAQQQQQVIGNAIKSGAWGGDRAGVVQAELARQQNLGNAPTLANIWNTGFNQAQQEFNTQQGVGMTAQQQTAANRLAAAGALGGLGQEAFGTTLQGAGAQLAAGTQQQQTQQAADTAAYQQFLRQAAYPFQNLSWLSGLTLPAASGMGGTTTSFGIGQQQQSQPGPNWGNSIIGGALSLASMFPFKDGGAVKWHRPAFAGGGAPYGDDVSLGSYVPEAPQIPMQHSLPPPPQFSQPQSSGKLQQQAGLQLPNLSDKQKSNLKGNLGGVWDMLKGGSDNIQLPEAGGLGSFGDFGGVYARGGAVRRGYDDGGGIDTSGLDAVPDWKLDDSANSSGVNPPASMNEWIDKQRSPSADLGSLPPQNTERLPRNVRNNNPGNIEDGPFAQSMPGYVGSDGRFARFESPEHGYGAMDRLLGSYAKKGLTTPIDIISRWAPASDNNDPSGYAATVAKKLGIGPTDQIDMSDPNMRRQLSLAMAQVEGGGVVPSIASTQPQNLGNAPRPALAYDDNQPQGQPTAGGLGAIADLISGHKASVPSSPGVTPAPAQEQGKILGLIPATPEMRQALLAAGLGMMASRSHWLGPAIGEGGLAGIGAYQNALNMNRQNALAQGQLQNIQSEIETRKAETGIRQQQMQKELLLLQRQIDAARAAAGIGGGDVSGTPVAPTVPQTITPQGPQKLPSDKVASTDNSIIPAPQPSQGGVGPAPAPLQGGPSAVIPSPAPVEAGAQPPQQPAPMSEDEKFLANVDPRNNPRNILQQADTFRQQAEQYRRQAQIYRGYAMPNEASALDAKADQMLGRANDLATRADTLAKGPLLLKDGTMGYLPSFVKAQSDYESQKLAAQEEAKNVAKPTMTPSGVGYIPPSEEAGAGATSRGNIGVPQQTQAPQKAVIDPRTAQVKTAIPPAPEGGGYPIPNVPKGAKVVSLGEDAKELAKTDSDFAKDMLSRAPVTDAAIERYRSMAQAFKTFESGSIAEQQHASAAFAAAVGYPEIARSIMRGEVSGAEWVRKEGVNIVLDTLKAATPRFAQSEFNKLSDQGTPNITNRPESNHQLVSEGLGLMLRNKAFMEDWEQARQNGWSSVSSFYTNWTKANPLSNFTRAAQRQIGNFKGMDLPQRSDWIEGGIYSAPKTMTPAQRDAFGKRGIGPGEMFRYDGATIKPVPRAETFSSYLGAQ